MEYRELGRSGIRVSAVCMGCWAIAGDAVWGPQDEDDALAAIRASLDEGVTFFDTAEAYGAGASERLLARGLGRRRREVVIATKALPRNLAPADLRAACERSLANLGADWIDLYQLHWASREVPLADTLGEMERLRQDGMIRAYGVSNFGPLDLAQALDAGAVVSDQLPYSLLWRAVEFEAQPLCVARGASILCYSPLCQGLLTGKFKTAEDVPAGRTRMRLFRKDRPMSRHAEPGCEAETFEALEAIRDVCEGLGRPMGEVALAWLLGRPGVAAVIAGCRDAAQARANSRAAGLRLDPGAQGRLDAATDAVKRIIGPNMDPWQTDSRMR